MITNFVRNREVFDEIGVQLIRRSARRNSHTAGARSSPKINRVATVFSRGDVVVLSLRMLASSCRMAFGSRASVTTLVSLSRADAFPNARAQPVGGQRFAPPARRSASAPRPNQRPYAVSAQERVFGSRCPATRDRGRAGLLAANPCAASAAGASRFFALRGGARTPWRAIRYSVSLMCLPCVCLYTTTVLTLRVLPEGV